LLVDVGHQRHLVVALLHVGLIDAYRVNPEMALAAPSAELALHSGRAVLRDMVGVAIDDDGLQLALGIPSVRHRLELGARVQVELSKGKIIIFSVRPNESDAATWLKRGVLDRFRDGHWSRLSVMLFKARYTNKMAGD
jgi:hypothetical protein